MPQIIETTVYHLDELPDGARDKARAWYREHIVDDDWFEFVYEDFETICAILGVRLKTRSVPLMNGGTRSKSQVFFSGFWSQGDGACFEAVYSYEKSARRRLIEHAPEDTTLHAIADALQSIQRRNFYHLRADIRHRGHYYHAYSMEITVERDSPTYQNMTADAEETIIEAMRDLASWLYRQLEREYEHQTSDATVDEGIIANEYTFTDAGRRFG